jgi:hypothetical protein
VSIGSEHEDIAPGGGARNDDHPSTTSQIIHQHVKLADVLNRITTGWIPPSNNTATTYDGGGTAGDCSGRVLPTQQNPARHQQQERPVERRPAGFQKCSIQQDNEKEPTKSLRNDSILHPVGGGEL